ncbi:MAG TPA: SRPBCC family protein [Candidatus Binatia bacterium]|nr:SRPBCC family protein [Candidatus Binatia bacterium]
MTDMATIADRDTLTLVRRLPGPIERVWAYLTDPQLLVEWFSDGVVADRVGGEVRFEMGATGRVTAFEPPRLLEYTWNELEHARGPIADTIVRWELCDEGDGVRLTLTHSRLPEPEVLTHGAGWHTFLERLVSRVNGREPEPIEKLYARLKLEYSQLAG